MPFTPFHFGPAALLKAVFPKHFSLIAFIFVQVIIDLETLYHLLKHEEPLHQFLHTYAGCNLAVIAAVLIYRPLHNFFLEELTWSATFISAIIGAYSHVFLDSIMHLDVKPWMPFTQGNAMWHVINVGHLHLLCIYCALASVGIFCARWVFRK